MKASLARLPRIVARSVPWKRMVPALGATMPRIMRASVVLPLPDSPTMVKISGRPASRRRLTPSTAVVLRREKAPVA